MVDKQTITTSYDMAGDLVFVQIDYIPDSYISIHALTEHDGYRLRAIVINMQTGHSKAIVEVLDRPGGYWREFIRTGWKYPIPKSGNWSRGGFVAKEASEFTYELLDRAVEFLDDLGRAVAPPVSNADGRESPAGTHYPTSVDDNARAGVRYWLTAQQQRNRDEYGRSRANQMYDTYMGAKHSSHTPWASVTSDERELWIRLYGIAEGWYKPVKPQPRESK